MFYHRYHILHSVLGFETNRHRRNQNKSQYDLSDSLVAVSFTAILYSRIHQVSPVSLEWIQYLNLRTARFN